MYINSKIVFKDYNPKENLLFPPNLSELIEEKHPVRVISNIIDGLAIKDLINGVTTFRWTQKLSLHAVSLENEKE